MPVLTADEIADIRLVTGITGDTTVISDTVIQTQYDLAYTDAPNSGLRLPYTYVYILRRLWGAQRKKADRTTDHGDRQTRSQITDVTKQQLDYWEREAGLFGGGVMMAGALALDTDATLDNQSQWDGTDDD